MVVLGKCIIWRREGKGMVWHKGILWRRRWYRWSPSISLGQPDRVASRWWINRQTTIATRKGVRLSGKPMFYDLYGKCKGKLVLKTARWDMAKSAVTGIIMFSVPQIHWKISVTTKTEVIVHPWIIQQDLQVETKVTNISLLNFLDSMWLCHWIIQQNLQVNCKKK